MATKARKLTASRVEEANSIELLFLQIERSQLRWFSHVSRMPQKRLLNRALFV